VLVANTNRKEQPGLGLVILLMLMRGDEILLARVVMLMLRLMMRLLVFLFGEIPIVGFEHSIWALDYIGDPNLPFTWRRIAGFKDVSSTYSGIEYVSSAAFLGGKGLIATNGSSCDNF